MCNKWLDELRSDMPKVKGAGRVLEILSTWHTRDSAEAWLEGLLLLAGQRDVSHVFVEQGPEGDARLRFRVDGVVFAGPKFASQDYEQLLAAVRARATMGESDEAMLSCEGILAGSLETEAHGFWVGLLRTSEGTQLSLCARRALETDMPWEGWPAQARTAMEHMLGHPNGLIEFCFRGWSSQVGTMARVFDFRIRQSAGRSRYAYVSDGPVGLPPREGTVQVRVEGSKESWEQALRALIAHDVDCVALAGRDEKVIVHQAVLTALEDRYIMVNVSRPDVVRTLLWLLSDAAIDPGQVVQELIGLVGICELRPVCPRCAYSKPPGKSILPVFERQGITCIPEGNWVGSEGCEECNGTGFMLPSEQRLPLVEAVYVDRELAETCVSRPSRDELESALAERGFRTYFQQAVDFARQGLTTVEESIRVGLARRADL